VRIDSTATDDITARRGELQQASAGDHRSCQKYRSANPTAHIRVEVGWANAFRVDAPGVVPGRFNCNTQTLQQPSHIL
jgi:hypothetical protein